VSVIMVAYALLAFILLNGLFALVLIVRNRKTHAHQEQIAQLTVLSRLMLYPAVFLLAVGIFLGALWANISWGRYWGWDPKEVWALITLLVYSVAFHSQSIALLRRPAYFHAYLVAAFLMVLMTYFGVNYFLGGMHSYA
jgi:ABC-type transport system involved in cytochrome c biogenesis permease subunit